MGWLRGRRVLVTGHTGFQGSWLCAYLAEAGARVHGYSLPPPTSPSMFEALALSDAIDDARGDVRDRAALEARIKECDPDAVIHLAAQPLVRRSYREPLETFDTNAGGTAVLLEALRGGGRPRPCVVMTSDKCYANDEDGRARQEHDRLGGSDPYSASKACAELVCAAYGGLLPGPLSTVRAGNVVGGGDWAEDRLVPDLARAACDGRPALVRNPGSVRPWQFVLEPLSALLCILEASAADPSLAGPYNAGPRGARHTAGEIASMFCSAWEGASWKEGGGAGVPEAGVLALDSSRIEKALGWRPILDAREAVLLSAEWYRAHRDGADMAELTRSQISLYQERARAAGARWA